MAGYSDSLERCIDKVVAPQARSVDEEGRFPSAGIEALSEAGILGLASSAEVGGGGGDLAAGADVIERLARECGSTAMVVLMHFAATAVIESTGPEAVRREIADGRHLSTLAFSEVGSRSHFWATQSTAVAGEGGALLSGRKSWVTAAAEADSYVFSTRPLAAEGPMTLWLVPRDSAGLEVAGGFDGLGLRGNGSVPITAEGVSVPVDSMLGPDGGGLDLALAHVLPWFLVLSGAFCLGLLEAVTAETGRHLSETRLEHLGQTLIRQPVTRAEFARMRIATDSVRALLADTLAALGGGREDAMLRVLEIKAMAGEEAARVSDLAMAVCGGAAFRKELGIERRFRDARAARVMAPTTDALLDFVGRAVGGLALLGD